MTSNEAASTKILPEGERQASRRPSRYVAVAGLAVVAVVQAIAFAYVRAHTNGPTPFVTTGHDLSDLSLRDYRGALQALGAGQPALLLVFDPNCAHSRRVAPLWSDWLKGTYTRAIGSLPFPPVRRRRITSVSYNGPSSSHRPSPSAMSLRNGRRGFSRLTDGVASWLRITDSTFQRSPRICGPQETDSSQPP